MSTELTFQSLAVTLETASTTGNAKMKNAWHHASPKVKYFNDMAEVSANNFVQLFKVFVICENFTKRC